MVRRRQAINPFYPLVVITGTAFAITAFAYGVMALKAVSPPGADSASNGVHPLFAFLDQHGVLLMGIELAVLAAVSFLAMGTDSYWSRARGDTGNAQPTGESRID